MDQSVTQGEDIGIPDSDPEKVGTIKSRGIRIPKDREVLTRRLIGALSDNTYEGPEAEAVARIVKDEDVVMELGGGIGFISSLAGNRCGSGEVHTFEANPALIPFIRRVHRLNGLNNIHINHALLGPRKGSATFYVRNNLLTSSLSLLEGDSVRSEETVEIRNAKSESKRIKPTVLICDIEGAETTVLPALDLSTVRVALVELHPLLIGPAGVQAVFEAMMASGLVYYHRRSQGKVVCFRREW